MRSVEHSHQAEQDVLRVCVISRPKVALLDSTHLWHRNIEVLIAYQKTLREKHQLALTFTHIFPDQPHYDVIIVFSRITAQMSKPERIDMLKKLRSCCHRLLWFSERDSAGSTEFEVLPYVDRYLMRQKYRHLEDYEQTYYFNRKYADFYATWQNRPRESFEANELLSQHTEHVHKIGLWWNIAYNILAAVPRWERWLDVYFRNKTPEFPPHSVLTTKKDIDLHAMFVIKDQRGAINAQRHHAWEKLATMQQEFSITPTDRRVSERTYFAYMKRSYCVLSPFGWGEICYRDFEGFLWDTCLLKPDMDDIDTWPDLFEKNQTYVPLAWDLNDLEEKLTATLADDYFRQQLTQQAYQRYISLWNASGIEALLDRFTTIIRTSL
ncbi:MAG: hypothetical protein RIG62_02420 [Cyclobacteriaceae bacterium]